MPSRAATACVALDLPCTHEWPDRIAGLGGSVTVAGNVTSKRDLAKVQTQFNAWAKETGLPYVQISRICAMSVGQNYDAETLKSRAAMDE